MLEKKRRYSICMTEKVHKKITKFVKVNKLQSLSSFLATAAEAHMRYINMEKKDQQARKKLSNSMGRIK